MRDEGGDEAQAVANMFQNIMPEAENFIIAYKKEGSEEEFNACVMMQGSAGVLMQLIDGLIEKFGDAFIENASKNRMRALIDSIMFPHDEDEEEDLE